MAYLLRNAALVKKVASPLAGANLVLPALTIPKPQSLNVRFKSEAHPYPWPKNWLYDPQLGYYDAASHGGVYKSAGRGRAPLSLAQIVAIFLYLTVFWFMLPIFYHDYNTRGKWKGKENKFKANIVGHEESGILTTRWEPDDKHKEVFMNDDSPYKTAYKWRELMDNPR